MHSFEPGRLHGRDFLEAGFLGGWFPLSKTAQEAKKRGALLFCGAERYNDMPQGKTNKSRPVFAGVSGMTRSERGGKPADDPSLLPKGPSGPFQGPSSSPEDCPGDPPVLSRGSLERSFHLRQGSSLSGGLPGGTVRRGPVRALRRRVGFI